MEDWPGLPPASGIDRTIYQNLVEMIPLMESFMEQKNRRAFTRHASMVYTPAPSRDTPLKKVSESPLNSKKNKQQRPGNAKQSEMKEETLPVWEEQENILRRVERDEFDKEQERLNKEELQQLQGQIDGLKQQLWEKDNILKVAQSYEAAEIAHQEEIANLKTKLEDMHKLLRDKEMLNVSIQSLLSQKQKELVNMETILDRVQTEVIKKNDATVKMREELTQLQVQVSSFQFQSQLENTQLDGSYYVECDQDDDSEVVLEAMSVNDTDKLEAARRMYLGAVITAKHKPGFESMTLAAETRKRLESFLTHPQLVGGEPLMFV